MSWELLREYIGTVIAEEVLSERLFGKNFDIRAFKTIKGGTENLERYVRKAGLPYLYRGSSRVAYMLSAGKVLKLATDYNDQNRGEVKAFQTLGREYVPQVFEWDPKFRWIIVEPIRTFGNYANQIAGKASMIRETGLSDRVLLALSLRRSKSNLTWPGPEDKSKTPEELYNSLSTYDRFADWDQLPPKGQELITKFLVLVSKGMFDIARFDHWGVGADQRIVCIDPGIFD